MQEEGQGLKPVEPIVEKPAGAPPEKIARLHRGQLFRKYFLLILALVCGALLISGGVGLYFAYHEHKDALSDLQREKAAGAAARIEQYVLQIEQHLSSAALTPLGVEGLQQRRIEFLKLLRLVPDVTDISQIDARGREQVFESRIGMSTLGSNEDRSQLPAFRNARADRTWFSPVYFRKDTEPYMSIAVRAGDSGPVTVAEVNLKFMWDVITRIRIGQKGRAYVVDGTGHLIADPDIGLVLRKTDLSSLEQVKAAFAPGADDSLAMVATDLASNRVLTAYAPIEPGRHKPAQAGPANPLGWKVFVEQPVSEVYAALDATILRTVALIVAGLLFSAMAAMWLARSMVRPISTLQEGAQRIGAGDLDQRIEVRTGDELQALAEQFNRMTAQLRESYAGLERKVEERTAELKQALDFQSASGEILASISGSIADTQPVFEAIVQSMRRLFKTRSALVALIEDGQFHLKAVGATDPAYKARMHAAFPASVTDNESLGGRAVHSGRVLQVCPVIGNPEAPARTQQLAQANGYNSILIAPMVREGKGLGFIATSRAEPVPFDDKEVALIKAFADQAVIAIENVRLFNETKESLEQQTATSEILKVISSSPTDVQPVLDAIVQSAAALFVPWNVSIQMREGDQLHRKAHAGPQIDQINQEELAKIYPMPMDPQRTVGAKAIAEGRIIEISDREAPGTPELTQRVGKVTGYRSVTVVPLMREGEGIGIIGLNHPEPGQKLSEKQLALVRTFADQAVIAIENVRLFNETKESLERQTATAEILSVISSTPTDVQPVFDVIVKSALRLLEGHSAVVTRIEEDTEYLGAYTSTSPSGDESIKSRYPRRPLSDVNPGSRAIATRKPHAIADYETDPDLPAHSREHARLRGYRSNLIVPMVREGTVVGTIRVTRKVAGAFPDHQVKLLQTFADQAVIAIENVRLFNETKESLEQQIATAEILKVISSSTTDTQPVFEVIVQSGLKLFPDAAVVVTLPDGDQVQLAAIANLDPLHAEEFRKRFPFPLSREYMHGLAILERRMIDMPDAAANTDASIASGIKNFLASGYRAVTIMPMMRGEAAIGTVSVVRSEPGPLTEKQLALLRTFADQAVIAIENVRLFNETKESLDQQTATSQILRVISDSPGDVKPILDAVAERATRLCEATAATIYVLEGATLRRTAFHGPAELQGRDTLPYTPGTLTGRAIAEGKPIHVQDLERAQSEFPMSWEFARQFGRHQTMLAVPLLREGRPFGTMFLRRKEVRPFTERQIALSKVFADQAAIGIENVRLFNETKEALEQQKASADVLGAISASIADTAPVFDKILESCQRLFEGHLVGVTLVEADGQVHLRAYKGERQDELPRIYPMPLTRESGTGFAILEQRVIEFSNVQSDSSTPPQVRKGAAVLGFASIVFAPMIFEGRGIGAIWVARKLAGAFSEKQIALLKTFADQAVIAIQNARLFREIQEKGAQLEIANKHKSEFLANMSHELRTPLNAIIGFSEVLIEKMFGDVNAKQADYLKDIHESGRHLLSLINDILDLSKIEAGRMDLEISTFDLPSALSNAMTLVRERAQRHGIELSLAVDKKLGAFQADERKFKQIVLNLLSNAVKFTPDGGRVDVSAKKYDGKIEVAVRDTGIGIAPEDHAAVFEEFKQVGRDYTKKAEGTGLGLTLTKRFVELHGGAISLESAPGKGSTFTITLPVRQ